MGSREACSFISIHAAIFLLSIFALKVPDDFLCSATFVAGGNETDQLALLNFKAKITSDPLRVLQLWDSSTHFCQWYGVTCGRRHQRVISLDLSSLKLAGPISPHVGNLSFLRRLYLQNNSFSQEIPSEIGRLARLEDLRLSRNLIGGEIPSNISFCRNLNNIEIGWNQLVGEIPGALGSLLKLTFIAANHNNLTGRMPASLGNLSSLVTIYLGDNYLDGSIPEALGRLTNLTEFIVSTNRLSGSIPPSLLNISLITKFDVGDNQIQGSLPSNLGNTLPNIREFGIGFNQFTGLIPISISNASNLERLQFPKNKLRGEVPFLEELQRLQVLSISANQLGHDLSFLCSLTNATKLWLLDININNFQGALPECICNLSTALEILAVDNNKIFGSVPAGIGNLVNLEYLEVWNNHFSGNVPLDIGKLQKLGLLYLLSNNFSGKIPYFLGNLTLLTDLRLNNNNFHGRIPLSLSRCQNLAVLDLSNNYLSGSIPPQVVGISSLSIYLDLSGNKLIGPLPIDVGNLKNLGQLIVHDNMLSGEIPSSLGSCQIPEFLTSFALLHKLNLSFNEFEGLVPMKGVFRNASATSVMGNDKLCGGIPEFQLPKCNFEVPKSQRLTTKLKAIIATVAGLSGAALMLSFMFFLRLRKKSMSPTSSPTSNSLLRVSYQNLHDATNGFSLENIIGTGNFGTVYKGVLQEGGPLIAVKVLNLQHHGAANSFMAECEALKNIRHRNLVKVLTACSSIDNQGNDFKALVYEFMVNGSLEEWLHPPAPALMDETPKSLNLLQRLNIAIDVASAIEYLHHHCETPIVHCDLKPSNVLLDDELTGHISDFGLAKFLLQSIHDHFSNQSSSIGLRGTIGYAPPEYGLGSEVSTFGDVYSFGILLLEMFTGKRPTNEMFKEGWNLHKFAKLTLPDKVAEIIDPIFLQEREVGTSRYYPRNPKSARANNIMECLISIVGIGVACSAELPRERMNMTDAAANLCSIRDKLLVI
ncbi:hypothetical protein P3X46_014370 [Hevea brasiliensis]|uniref:Protein kinase domain-containing protein n=1 Tax=Hevea brasiliensis TaxID=3981 RepID=A0ABQ9M6G3_HEVBR|nr:hypothetical protein P3X46_014370 [Hevea brasiliensis]